MSDAAARAPPQLELGFDGGVLRPWRRDDAAAVAEHANSRAVWINCSDRFAHPYTRAHADAWIDTCLSADPPGAPLSQLAIDVGGAAAGGVGAWRRDDVQRRTMELGYWLGEAHWGRGVGGAAVGAFLEYLWEAFPDTARVEAVVYSYNQRSCRLLERRGFRLEGCLRDAAFKDGKFADSLVYGLLRRDVEQGAGSTGGIAAAAVVEAGGGAGAGAGGPAAEGQGDR